MQFTSEQKNQFEKNHASIAWRQTNMTIWEEIVQLKQTSHCLLPLTSHLGTRMHCALVAFLLQCHHETSQQLFVLFCNVVIADGMNTLGRLSWLGP